MAKILITGATSGLGLALAVELVKASHHLLLHGRDRARLAEITSRTGAEGYLADLGSLHETRQLAAEVAARHDGLHVLVNNAGVGFPRTGTDRTTSADGHEPRLAVNYPAPVLLTQELLPLLRAAAPSRIDVASGAQEPFDFGDPPMMRGFGEFRAYARSKLAMISWTATVAEELAGQLGDLCAVGYLSIASDALGLLLPPAGPHRQASARGIAGRAREAVTELPRPGVRNSSGLLVEAGSPGRAPPAGGPDRPAPRPARPDEPRARPLTDDQDRRQPPTTSTSTHEPRHTSSRTSENQDGGSSAKIRLDLGQSMPSTMRKSRSTPSERATSASW